MNALYKLIVLTTLVALSSVPSFSQRINLGDPFAVRGTTRIVNGGTGRNTPCATSDFIIQSSSTTFGCLDPSGVATSFVTPEQYGAVGDGVADDTTALSDAIDAAVTAGLPLRACLTYKTTATISKTLSNVSIDGCGTGTILPTAASGTIYGLELTGGAVVTQTGFNETISRATALSSGGAQEIDVDSAAGFAVGDFVRLIWDDGAGQAVSGQVSRLRSIVSNTFAFNDPVLIAADPAASNTVRKIPTISKIRVSNMKFDGSGCLAVTSCYGLYIVGVVDSEFRDLDFRFFNAGTLSGGFVGSNLYNVLVDGIRLYDSGTGGISDLNLFGLGRVTVNNINSELSGFGPQVAGGVLVKGSNWVSSRSQGRGIKINGIGWSSFNNLSSSFAEATGLSITNGSFRNSFDGGVQNLNGTAGDPQPGIWFSSQDNDYNILTNVRVFGNNPAGVGSNVNLQLWFPTTDDNNTVTGDLRGHHDDGDNNKVHYTTSRTLDELTGAVGVMIIQPNKGEGSSAWCSDCTPDTNPCTGSGDGALAVRTGSGSAFRCL